MKCPKYQGKISFNLSDSGVRERVFEGIGLVTNFSGMSALEIAREQFYQRKIINIINNRPDDEALFRNQLNSIMQSRADDVVLQNAEPPLELRSTFSYSAGETGLQEMRLAFDYLVNHVYEQHIGNWLNGIEMPVKFNASQERAVLLSLSFNSRTGANGLPTLLGSNLRQALIDGNRADAWYEIRYGSNGSGNTTTRSDTAARRYFESYIFGLYNENESVSDDSARQTYEMYTNNRVHILNYERVYSNRADSFVTSESKTLEKKGTDLFFRK